MNISKASSFRRTILTLLFSCVVYSGASPGIQTGATAGEIDHSQLVQEYESPMLSVAPITFNTPGEFRFITPIAPNPHDPSADFDADLLPYLTVTICKVNGAECAFIKSFTSTTSPDRLRIENKLGRFFIANWNTGAEFDNTPVYRISVEVPGETLGSVDLPPSAYRQWGRTWPIKFIVEKDSELWVRMLAAAGMTLWEVADDLRTNFGICDDEMRDLLLNTYPDTTGAQVAEVVEGVCQEVVLQPNTKIVDKETRDALAFFDMSTGRLIFAGDTVLLRNLNLNDVIVSRQSPAAPYGYLRKVMSIRKSKGIYTLETVQAKFTEAIQVGTLQVSGPLEPSSVANNAAPNKIFAPSTNSFGDTIDIGQQIPFTRHIDEVINLDGGDDEIGGTGTIRVVGDIEIRAGYNIGAGIELCATPPFACADRVEAWMGFVHKSNLRVTGTFDGHLRKEFKYPIPMSPIFFMIGPVPVWLVPEVNVIVGFDGNAHVDFEFDAGAQSNVRPYIKWTEDEGWKDLSTWEPLSNEFLGARFSGDARLEGYAKLDAALLLYGAIGPSMDGSLGIVGEAKTGGSPFWKISGRVQAGIGLKSAITDLFDIDAREAFLDKPFLIMEAPNIAPDCSPRTHIISANIGSTVYLGPIEDISGAGYFTCTDPEGETIRYSFKSTGDGDEVSNSRREITFRSPGERRVDVIATDASGGTEPFSLRFNVFNPPPEIRVLAAVNTVPVGVQYFLNALVYDPDAGGYLQCFNTLSNQERVVFLVEPQHTARQIDDGFDCTVEVIFNEVGTHTITVRATDAYGATSDVPVNVNVTSAPSNAAPSIDPESVSFEAVAAARIRRTTDFDSITCEEGQRCRVPNGEVVSLGAGSLTAHYRTPFYMSLSASDSSGSDPTVIWWCREGATAVQATSNSDGTYSCNSFGPDQEVFIGATVSDGTTTVYSEIRMYRTTALVPR